MKAGDGDKLGEVLRRYTSMRVEDYQRTYSWTNDDIDDFFADLIAASDSSVRSHFFGTLIFQEDSDNPSRVTIVDGQQRVTTVFITIAAIRDAVSVLSEETIPAKSYGMAPERPAEEATKLIVSGVDINFYRYEANRFIKPIMDASVFMPPDSQQKLKTNHKPVTLAFRHAVKRIRATIADELPSGSDLDKLTFLNHLLATLTNKFRVLTIETESLSESLDIFLTLNDRGQELGPSDIVKGKLMSSLGRGLSEAKQLALYETINNDWKQLTEDVKEPETFLRHYLISSGVEKVQKKAVVNLVDKRMKGDGSVSEVQATENFWRDIKLAAGHYNILVNAAMNAEQAKLHVTLLEGLQKSHRIFLMAALRNDDLYGKKTMEEIVRLTFVLSYRWAGADKGRQSLEDAFHDLAICALGVSADQNSSLARDALTGDELVAKLRGLVDEVEVDFLKIMRRDIDSSFISRAALYCAHRLTVGNAIGHSLKDLHLEHIAPQTGTTTWVNELFGDDSEGSLYEDTITSIGNLTLLDPALNHKLLNKPFAEKRAEYEKSSMYLTTNLAKFEIWSEEIIKARTIWLSELFSAVCSNLGPSKDTLAFADWYESHGLDAQ